MAKPRAAGAAAGSTASPSAAAAADGVRVYVGGLPQETTSRELRERFGGFVRGETCELQDVELLAPVAGFAAPSATHRGFAYLTLAGAGAEEQCARLIKTFHRTKWRGSVLRLELARPDFRLKLEREWAEARDKRQQAELRARAARPEAQPVSELPLKLSVAFRGKRRTSFSDVDELQYVATPRRKLPQPVEHTQMQPEMKELSESETESEEEVQEAPETDAEASSEAEGETESEAEMAAVALADGEDDVEAFVRQVEQEEAMAAAGQQSSDEDGTAPKETLGDNAQDVEAFVQQAKREDANAKRLAALEAKQEQKRKQQQTPAIISVSGSTGGNKKITFDDSGNEQEVETAGDEDGENAGGAIANWMDSSDDEAEEQERQTTHGTLDFATGDADVDAEAEAQQAFALRPEFVGERGKQLFELQKRFGGDSRFRLDARFLEETDEFGGNDVNDEDEDSNAQSETEAEIELQNFLEEADPAEAAREARELREEQERVLRVIVTLFPDLDVARLQRRSRAPKDPLKEAAWMGQLKRYDPRDAHARREFELPDVDVNGSNGADPAEDEELLAARQRREQKPVVTGGERFFATSDGLGGLFSRVRKNSEDGEEGEAALDGVLGLNASTDTQEATAGTFKLSSLFSLPVEANGAEPLVALGEQLLEDDEQAETAGTGWGFHTAEEPTVTDSEGDDEQDEHESEGEDQQPGPVQRRKVKKSLADFLAFGRSFVGGATTPEDWPERRRKLTLDYKRKRRDALKSRKRQQQQQHKARAAEPQLKKTRL